MAKQLSVHEIKGICNDISNGDTNNAIEFRYNISYTTVQRVRVIEKCINALDVDELTDRYRKQQMTQIMYDWAKEEIYRRMDELTRPAPVPEGIIPKAKLEAKEMTDIRTSSGSFDWISQNQEKLNDISSFLKVMAASIDTFLNMYNGGEATKI